MSSRAEALTLGPDRKRATRFGPAGRALAGRNPSLRRMLGAAFISTCGDRLHQVALAALVLGATNSMASAGLVFVVSTLPFAVFGLPAGALVDRWDRRQVMVVADLVRAGLVLFIPLAAATSLPLVYALLFALTCATMLFTPARQAIVPDLVGSDDLGSANSSLQAVNYVVDLIALPAAGVLVALLVQQLGLHAGTSVVFGLDAASYVASAALLLGLPRVAPRPREAGSQRLCLRAQVTKGLRHLWQNPELRTNTVLLTVGPLLLGSLHTLWIGFAWRVSNTQTLGYGVTESAYAVGTLAGLWLLGRVLARTNPGRTVLFGFAIMGAAIAAAGFTDSLPVAACLAAVAGLGNMLFIVPSVTLVQRQTPPELRGRVLAVRMMLSFSAFSVSNALAGGLSDSVGVGPLFVALGAGMVLMSLAGWGLRSAREAGACAPR